MSAPPCLTMGFDAEPVDVADAPADLMTLVALEAEPVVEKVAPPLFAEPAGELDAPSPCGNARAPPVFTERANREAEPLGRPLPPDAFAVVVDRDAEPNGHPMAPEVFAAVVDLDASP